MVKEIKKQSQKTIGSVIKAIDIIELLSASEREIGATEISSHLNYGVSATYHILATLRMCGVIEQNPNTKKYRLGLKLCKIGNIAREQNHLSTYVQPYLKKLKELTGETSNLTILDNDEIIYIAQEESDKLVRMFTKIGARAPLYCSAAGKVLLAYQPKEKQDFIINGLSFYNFTKNTITSKKDLREELEEIKNIGYAFDNEERELGVECIAAPIFDFDDEVIGAISVSGPTTRFNQTTIDRFISDLLDITREISAYLENGY